MAEKLNVNATSTPKDNISHETLKTAAEIFTFLNYCPPKLLPLISNVLRTETPKNIILALTSIKGSKENPVKKSAMKILIKVLETLKLKTYEKIQTFTKGTCCMNDIIGECIKENNYTNEDIRLLGWFDSQLLLLINSTFVESMKIQNVAHVNKKDDSGKFALIPFCEFGGNMSVMGVKVDQFDDPVCNSFRPRIVMDQLCYQVDPNEYTDKIDLQELKEEGEISLTLFIHYNEDRQMEDMHYQEKPFITIDTISNRLLF